MFAARWWCHSTRDGKCVAVIDRCAVSAPHRHKGIALQSLDSVATDIAEVGRANDVSISAILLLLPQGTWIQSTAEAKGCALVSASDFDCCEDVMRGGTPHLYYIWV